MKFFLNTLDAYADAYRAKDIDGLMTLFVAVALTIYLELDGKKSVPHPP